MFRTRICPSPGMISASRRSNRRERFLVIISVLSRRRPRACRSHPLGACAGARPVSFRRGTFRADTRVLGRPPARTLRVGGGARIALLSDAELRYDADSGTGLRHRSRCGVYRWPLRVQRINTEIRPTKASGIFSMKIISRSSFPLQVKARAGPGLSRLKLQCFSREPALSLFTER